MATAQTKGGKFGTAGGNGGYSKRRLVKDVPNPKKPKKAPYDFSGKRAR